MKKWLVITGLLLITLAIILVIQVIFYYPSLPIDSISQKEALHSINSSSSAIVKIAEENNIEWYITRSEGNEHTRIKQMIGQHGWEFQEQDGSGYFFLKNGEKLIATTEMWTGKYVLIKIPQGWRN